MKHITTDLSTQNLGRYESAPDLTRPNKVWVQLAEIFGNAFFRENGDQPPNLWVQAISKLSDQQIAIGLANLGNDGLRFPPNLSIFIAACKRHKPVRQLGVKALPMSDAEQRKNAELAWDSMEKLAGRRLRP